MNRTICENSKMIFSYLKPYGNNKLSELDSNELDELIFYLNQYYLEYRDYIGLSQMDTFGIEIEIEHFVDWQVKKFADFQLDLYKIIGTDKWDVRNDRTLFKGREIVSDILTDDSIHWDRIKKACDLAYNKGKIDVNCSSHIHVGAQVLGENTLYWYRLFKLWSVYENVIYRFCYGEYLTHRPNISDFARPAALFLDSRLKLLDANLDYSVIEMLRIIEPLEVDEKYTKKFGISYWRMLADNNFDPYDDFNKLNNGCTIEFRVPNPTLDEVIIQNNINFLIKLMLYCKSDRFDYELLDRRMLFSKNIKKDLDSYSMIYLEQALELCDMIFDNNLDKLYFLRQYLKNFDVAYEPFVRAKKFSVTRR